MNRATHLPLAPDVATLFFPVIFLSPRDWFAQWPRRLQGFAVALLLLATIAQSWHVCAMGGHAMTNHELSVSAGAHEGHGTKQFKVIRNTDGTPGPVVCVCASEDEPGVATVAALPDAHSHVTCLALLLQTMPLQAGVPFTLELRETQRTTYAQRAQITPAFASPFELRGRAPPATC